MTQQIIRTDKFDGSEHVVTREDAQRAVASVYDNPEMVMAELDEGHSVRVGFAYYQIREVEETN